MFGLSTGAKHVNIKKALKKLIRKINPAILTAKIWHKHLKNKTKKLHFPWW